MPVEDTEQSREAQEQGGERRRGKKRDEDNAKNKKLVRARMHSYSRQNSFIISELKT